MTALDSNKVSSLQKIRELQDQIDMLKAEIETEQESFNWDEAPVICELNGYRWLLGKEADDELDWQDAKDWCEAVGGELPTREVLLMAYLNEDIKPLFKEFWHWSSTEFNATGAWRQTFTNGNQTFTNGNQTYGNKTSNYYVRAVRKVLI